jgi:hypothetical protein
MNQTALDLARQTVRGPTLLPVAAFKIRPSQMCGGFFVEAMGE